MIEVTNNARSFFGESDTPIYIYGAGNPGQWVSEYMERCHMEYEGFIDKAAGAEDCIRDALNTMVQQLTLTN